MADDSEITALLAAWCAGDGEAIAELVRRDTDWIRKRIRRGRGGHLAAEVETVDQVQDLILNALRYRPRFVVANRRQLRALLGRMIDNDLAERARRARRRPDVAGDFRESVVSLDPRVAVPRSPSSQADENENLAWIRIALEFLGDEQRLVVRRHLFEGMPFTSLEEELGANADTLRMRFTRAVARLTGIVQRLQAEGLDAMPDAES